MPQLGVVVIGRNEGERLQRCLLSLEPDQHAVVYVDSGSTDDSPTVARSLGVAVVDLNLAIPFTAARARNAGFERLLQLKPATQLVQFIDGDCEMVPTWFPIATEALLADSQLAVVCGRRRERHPNVSIYNRLCDIEWDTPVGEARSCGGDALMRVSALLQVGGYDPTVIAAEDDELCFRLRSAGWKIRRIAAEMTIHDAAMIRFGQWWRRAMRCGFAYAQGAFMHGQSPERHFVRERRRIILWGFLLPLLFLGFAWPSDGISLAGFLLYGVQMARTARRTRHRGIPKGDAQAYGIACTIAKVPELIGIGKFYLSRWRRKPTRIIEYK